MGAIGGNGRMWALGALIGSVLLLGGPIQAAAAPLGADLSAGGHDADLGEVSIHYTVRGSGPLLFVAAPGWGSGSDYLQDGLQPLASRFTLIFVDMRGSGGSSRPADRLRMSQSVMADDIEGLRRRFRLDVIDILGHSDGGAIALEYAKRHPSHVRKLLLIDPGVLGDRLDRTTARYLKLWANDPQYRDAARMAMSDWTKGLTDESFAKNLGAQLPLYVSDPERYAAALEKSFSTTRLSAYAMAAEAEADLKLHIDQTRGLDRVRADTLIINGTVDWCAPYPAAQRLSKRIPKARLSLYANKGHVPWIEASSRFFDEVTRFFQS